MNETLERAAIAGFVLIIVGFTLAILNVIGAIDRLDGIQLIIENVVEPAELHFKTDEYVGDSHGLEKLVGLYYSVDEIDVEKNQDALNEIENSIKFSIKKVLNDRILVLKEISTLSNFENL